MNKKNYINLNFWILVLLGILNINYFYFCVNLTHRPLLNVLLMKKTVKDLNKLTSQGVSYLKAGIYYLAVPVIFGLGLKTMDLQRIFGGN
jgi:hypothetical protein